MHIYVSHVHFIDVRYCSNHSNIWPPSLNEPSLYRKIMYPTLQLNKIIYLKYRVATMCEHQPNMIIINLKKIKRFIVRST